MSCLVLQRERELVVFICLFLPGLSILLQVAKMHSLQITIALNKDLEQLDPSTCPFADPERGWCVSRHHIENHKYSRFL